MAPSLKYNITEWQLFCSNIKKRGVELLKTREWSDCVFLVGASQVQVKAHKLMLAMASPVFEAMFYGPVVEENGPISIPDVEENLFNAMLEYIYTEDTKFTSCEMASALYHTAQNYLLPHLLLLCTKYITKNLTPQNASQMCEFAKLIGDAVLQENCSTVINSTTQASELSSCQ